MVGQAADEQMWSSPVATAVCLLNLSQICSNSESSACPAGQNRVFRLHVFQVGEAPMRVGGLWNHSGRTFRWVVCFAPAQDV